MRLFTPISYPREGFGLTLRLTRYNEFVTPKVWYNFRHFRQPAGSADTITVTKNEILYSLNKPDDFILAVVEFMGTTEHRIHYLRRPFLRESDFGVTSVNYNFAELLTRSEAPA